MQLTDGLPYGPNTDSCRIFTLGAFEVKLGHESLVGFVTARLGPLNDVNPEVCERGQCLQGGLVQNHVNMDASTFLDSLLLNMFLHYFG